MRKLYISASNFKRLPAIIFIFFISFQLSAQTITNYTFAASSGTFTALSSPTNLTLSGGTVDDGYFNNIPISFNFWYMGTRYTTISASTNGWLTLGANISNSAYLNNLSGGTQRPVIAPLWDDLDVQVAANVSYKITGSAPNRVFTIQYLNAQWQYNATGNTISFQVNLYETTGKIEFIYRPETGTLVTPTASVGISAIATGSGNFLSVNNAGTSVSSTTEANVTTKPVSGKRYAFTPPVPTAPGSLTFANVGITSMTLNWMDLSSNETGFVIYQSTDGTNYSFVSQTAPGAISSIQSGLTENTTYYWKIYAVSEGGLSAALGSSQATTTQVISNWLYRKAITIDHTKVGAGPHANFPVLISRTDADLQAKAQTDGDDILFTAADGTTKLDHQIESYTSGTGAIVAWVKIPSLSSAVNTVIYMHYGNAAATSQQNVTGTWDATFKGVWHLNNTFTDATSNANNGTNTGTIAATGKISGGSGFVRSNGADYITVLGKMGSPASFTLSAWANITTADINAAEIISIADNSVLRYDASNSKTNGVSYDGANWNTTLSSTNYAAGWHYVVYTFDDAGNSQQIYIDGQPNGATTAFTTTPNYAGGTNTFIGTHGNGNTNMDFDGTIDEARVAGVGRQAGWILTEFNNQNDPSTFYNVGSEAITKTFTGTGNFSDVSKWTGGTLPVAGENFVIDGVCTVDNNAGTDNVAYGTLIIGTATGRTLNWASGGTNRLNVTSVNAGAGASALNMTNGGTLIIRGTFASTNLTFTPGTGTIELQATSTLPIAYATYNNLTLNNASATFTAAVNTTVSGSLSVTGTFQLTGFSVISGGLQGTGVITSSAGTPTLTTGSSNTSTTFSGIIGTGSIAVTKNGTGALTLSGSNTYTGVTTIASGTVKLGSANALGTTAGATVVTSGAALDINGINYSNAETLTLNGTGISTGGTLINSNATAATYAGNITLGTTAPQITASNPITLSGIISGGNASGINSLTVAGNSTLTGALTLSGNNTYTGLTTVNSGALLKIGANNALGAAAPNGATDAGDGNSTIINWGGVLDLNGITYTRYEGVRMNGAGFSAAGDGCIINSSSTPAIYSGCVDPWSPATLYIANPVTFNGMVQFRYSNSFTKTGSSTLTLSPTGGDRTTSNSFLIINAGTLKLGTNLTEIGSATVYTRVSSGAVLDLNGFTCARYLYLNGTGISSGGALTNGSSTAATHSGSIIPESASSIVGGAGTIAITGTVAGAGFGLTLGGDAGGSVTNIISGTLTTVTKADAGTWTMSGANTFSGGTTLSAGQLNINHATAIGSGAFTISGGIINNTTAGSITLSNNNTQNWNGDFTFTGTQALNMGTGAVTLSASRQITVNASTLTVGGIINQSALNLTKAGSGTLIFGNQTITLNHLTISAGTLTATSGSLNVAGNFSNNGTFTHNSGTVNFNGVSQATIGGATFNNLTINNAAGVLLTANVTFNAILTLSNGVITTYVFTLIAAPTASVSRTSGHVTGTFQKNIATGITSKTFEIGDADNYTPVTVNFASVTTAGNLTAGTATGDHASIGSATIVAAKTANRNWMLTNSGIVFTTYSATFTFVAGDLDAGATTSSFIVGLFSAGWTYPTVGTKTSTSTQATGLTTFGDFQLGEMMAATKTFTGTGNFSEAARWTNGTLPAIGENLVIDGACTVDNNAGTDNITYGTLIIGTETGRTLSWVAGGTNRLNVSNVSAGAGASTLSMTNGGTLIIRGTWTSTNLSFTSGTGTIEIQSTITLPAAYATYKNLTINGSGITVNPGAITAVTGNVTITAGTFNDNNFNLSVGGNWTNNVSTTAFTAGTATVTFNSTTAQVIGGSCATTFNNLTVANTGATVTLNVNTSISGNLSVSSGTFDLAGFTANRASSGGTLTVSNNATLKIGGTNTYPTNYTTNTLVVASTVEYAGTNQTVANQSYGNLILGSSSGDAIKTFPATALAVVGNLTSALGAGTSVSFTAASDITVTGNVSIGASTTFNGGSYLSSIAGNWVNSGTFNGNTGTVSFTGSGKTVSGSGTQNFNNLTVAASGVQFSTGGITLTGNLATTGSGSFSQASGETLLMTGSGTTINGTGISLDNLTVSGSISTATSLNLTGNLSVSGSFTASAGTITMSGASKTMSGAGTRSFNVLSVTGSVTTVANFSISSGLTVSGSLLASAGTATFTGTATLSGTANLFNTTINGTSLQLSTNSILGVANALTITAGTLDVTSSIPNTVRFNGTVAQNINAITYGNLVLSNGNTKTAAGPISTNHNITIATGTTFNPSSYTHSIYGNWTNNGTFTPGTSTIQFLGSSSSSVSGATTFNILTSNTSSSTTTLILQSNIAAAIVNMTNGIILTGTNTLTITGSRSGNGIILGNIQRTHDFTTGVAYAFEGPDNTISFSAVSSVTSVTVSVVKGSVSDFPFGGSIGREYTIAVPAGTYTATLRLHYEDGELNGSVESSMGLWNYNGSAWIAIGKTANSTTSNYVEQSGLTNITDRWTCSDNSNVVQWNGSVSTDWNTAANWSVLQGSASMPPSVTDIVNLGNAAFTYQPTINNAVSVKNIIFGTVQAITLSMASGGSLTSGDIHGTWSSNITHTINANDQSITINGDLELSDGINGHAIDFNIGSGSVTIAGSLVQTGGANINFSGTGTLNIAEDFHYNSGTFTAGSGTVIYDGSENQYIAHLNYNHLTIDKVTGIAEIDSVVTIAGNLFISSGQLNNGSAFRITGNVTIASGASLYNSDSLYVGGNWLNNGDYIAAGAHMVFNGGGTQTITASTFNHLVINKPVGSSAILTGNVVINGDLTITSGTFDIKTFNCNRSTQGGTATLADSGTFIIGGNNIPANFSNNSLANSSTVILDGTGAQSIVGVSFGNLIFRNAGLKTVVSPVTVNGNLTVESGATLNGSSQTITLNGNWIDNGTFTPSTSTVICAGTSKTITGNTTFNVVTVTGSYTILNNVTFNNLLNITNTGSISGGGAIHTTLHGDLINSGVLYTLGTTTFSGNTLQTLSLINAVQTVALIVNFNGSVSPVLNSTSVPQYGYLNINNTGGVNPSVGWTILYSLAVGSGASFNGGNSTHNILGSVTNNGTITSSGTLNFIPSSTVTVNLGSNFSSTGTVNFGGAGAMTQAGTAASFYNIVISNTNVAGITSSTDWNMANNLTVNTGSLLNAGNRSYAVGGNLLNNGTISSGTSTFTLNGAGTQNIYTMSAFNKLTINKTADSAILSSNVTVNGALNITAGTLHLNTFSLMIPGTSTFTAGTINNGTVTASGSSAAFSGTVFGATVNATSDSLYLNGSTFNNTVTLTKTGSTDIISNGGNAFNSTATISNNGTANFTLANLSPDIFNGVTVFTNTGTAALYIAYNAPGSQFNGNVTFNNTGTGSTIGSSYGALATATYKGNIVVNNTSTGGIYFGYAGATTTLAALKTISIGGTGFTKGILLLRNFTQLGSAAQVLTLTGTALLQIEDASIFNGNINFVSPQLKINGSTYNGTTSLTKNGATDNPSSGGNIFNGVTTLQNSGSGSLDLANSIPETFNADLTINNTGGSRIQLGIGSAGNLFNGNVTINHGGNTGGLNTIIARNAGSTATINGNLVLNNTNVSITSGIIIANTGQVTVNGNIIVSSINGRGVLFGDAAGTVILASGFTITDAGPGSFTTGALSLKGFTQSGATAQNIALTGTATLLIGPTSQFNGAVNFSAPQLFLNGSQYNNTAVLIKNGDTDNTSTGGNIFNAATTITNSGTGFLRLSNTIADDFNSDATFIQTGSGLLQPAYARHYTIAGNLSTEGTTTAISFGTATAAVIFDGTGAQLIGGSLPSKFNNLTISNTGSTVTAAVNSNIAGNLAVTTGTFDLGSFTADRLTAGGTLTVSNGATLKTGGTNTIPANYTTHSMGATSTIEYNGTGQSVAVLNSAQNYGHLVVSGSGTEILSGNIAVRNNLSIIAGSLNINTYTLKIGGNITNSGLFTASQGTIEMNGTAPQTIPAATFSGNMIRGLTVNNTAGVTLGGALSLIDVLTVSNGNLAADGYLTLKSTDTATARVAAITSVAATPVSGHVITERYVPGRRKYRLMTSTVTTSAGSTLIAGQEALSIWGNWQNGGINTSPNMGNLITGGSTADGFDAGTANASLFTYNNVSRSYDGYTTANGKNTKYTPLKAGVAYLMFVYGDRLNSVFATSPHNTVLVSTGTLLTGDQLYNTGSAIPLSGVTGQFTLLGNPFASPINWATIPKTNIDNAYWGWDPNLSSTGGYITVTTLGDVVLQAPYSGSTGLNQYIQSGQGFFVKTSGASPVMTIREQDKVPTFNGNAFRVSRTAGDLPLLAINLQYVSSGNKILADGVLAAFDATFSNHPGSEDASKMANSAESIAILNDTTSLSIDARQMPQNNDTLFLNVSRLTKPQYTLQIFAQQMASSNIIAYLRDRYLNTIQPLSLSDTNNIVVHVSAAIPASSDINRFQIIFNAPVVVLPVTFTSITATQKNKDIQVRWEVAEESQIRKYEVEKSAENINFYKVAEVPTNGNNGIGSYQWLDEHPVTGNNYYRIRAIQTDARSFVSKTAVVKMNARNAVLTISPNPVKNKRINIRSNEMEKGKYLVLLYNPQGREIIRLVIDHPGGSFNQVIYCSNMLPAGIYYLHVTNEENEYEHLIFLE